MRISLQPSTVLPGALPYWTTMREPRDSCIVHGWAHGSVEGPEDHIQELEDTGLRLITKVLSDVFER